MPKKNKESEIDDENDENEESDIEEDKDEELDEELDEDTDNEDDKDNILGETENQECLLLDEITNLRQEILDTQKTLKL